MVAASLSATFARSYAVSATLIALAAHPTPPVRCHHARESRHGSTTPVDRYSCQSLVEPIEASPWLRASRVAPINPRGLWLHSPRSGCTVQLGWHARDGRGGAGASWASWASSPAFPLLRHRGGVGASWASWASSPASPRAEAPQAASPPLEAQTSWRVSCLTCSLTRRQGHTLGRMPPSVTM